MSPETQPTTSDVKAGFNFWQQWYPLAPLEDLDPNRPTSVMLLGLALVIWQPRGSDRYAVFQDQCPHRLAPLSEGRIDERTGHLMCSYHGWQFDADGSCTSIPQAEHATLITPKRQMLCATALPCQQQNGLLWVWPDAASADLAATKPLPLSPLVNADAGFVWSVMVRDLAYDWQTLVENVADPSHVPFAHHGLQGNRDRAKPVPMEIRQSTSTLIEVIAGGNYPAQITFEPPCRLEYELDFGKGRQVGLVTYCIPVAPGRSRLIAQFPRNFAKAMLRWTPRWVEHLRVRNPVLDGDMILLHAQERALQQRLQQESWKTAYRMPTSADRLVIEFRQWLDNYAQGQLPWDPSAQWSDGERGGRDRQVLLDRYHQHTLICSSCRGALQMVQRLQVLLLAYFAVSVAGVALLPDSLRLTVGLPLILLALLGLGAYAGLKYKLEPQFYFVDYVHGDR